MSISQENIKWISEVSGVSIEEISGALSNEEEVSLGFRLNGQIKTEEDIKGIRESGIKQGKELNSKDIAKALGITLDSGEKDAAIVADKLKSSLESSLQEKYKNLKPSENEKLLEEKVKDWEGKYGKLKETFETRDQEYNGLQEKYNQEISKAEALNWEREILKSIPDKIKIDKSDAVLIIKNNIKVEKDEDGNKHILLNGKKELDNMGNPQQDVSSVIKSFVESKKWVGEDSGMGGKDRNGDGGKSHAKGKTAEEAMQYIKDKGVAPSSPEGLEMFKELTSK